MSSDSRRIEDWHGPVEFGGKVLQVGPITIHSNREIQAAVEHQEPLPASHPECSDEACCISRIQSPTSPDLPLEGRKKTFHHEGQCNGQQ